MKLLQSSLLMVLLTSPVYAQTSSLFVNSSEVGIGTTSPIVSLDASHQTDAIALPVGTSGTRPSGANLTNGELRYNSTTPAVEAYVNGAWTSLGIGAGTVNSGTQYQLGYYATTGAAISGTSSITTDASGDLTVSGSVTPSQTGGIVGTTTNNNAAAGSVGEYVFANCATNLSANTVTITIASPAVVTWTGYPMTGAGTWTCPVYFTTTGTFPTGITTNTTYYIIPLTSNTFELATTAANALSGTAINTSGSQSGTQSAYSTTYNMTTMAWLNAGAITLTAGDWQVSATGELYQISGTSTAVASNVNTTSNTGGTNTPQSGLFGQIQGTTFSGAAINTISMAGRVLLSSTTNEYLVDEAVISSGSTQGTGFIGARRVR